jgi:hypothetical protein
MASLAIILSFFDVSAVILSATAGKMLSQIKQRKKYAPATHEYCSMPVAGRLA